jgi:3-oxoacyl-[acyl-carrier protein] reductase
MGNRLRDKIAIVTGAGSGMGEAIAHTYAREGAKVAVLDVNEQAANKVASAIGANALAVACDVTNKADIMRAVEMTEKKFGVTDILVNNAGVAHVNKPLMEIDEREYDRVFDVNVKGLFMFTQAVVPAMRKSDGGVIVNIGSTAGLRPRPGLSAYNATKGAVHNLTKTLAVELAPDKIRVCAIAPVANDTPLLPTFLGPAPGQREKFIATVPLGRLATSQDIADAALFLASAEAKFLTGNIMEVDGGRCV